jgi:hypothetical protein
MWSIGAMSQNEIRELEDLNPIEGGDELYIPLNMAPSSRVNELLDNKAKQNTIDVTPSEDDDVDESDNQKNKTKLKMLTNKKS